MAALQRHAPALFSSVALADGLVSSLVRLALRFDRTARTRRALAKLDADGLADIGLTREAAMIEAAKPFWKV